MNESVLMDVRAWAGQQWRALDLHDVRLERRAIEIGQRIARQPAASLPQQMGAWKHLQAAYRFLNNPAVSFERLSQPIWQATRVLACQERLVLLVQDRTELDFSHFGTTLRGLGPIGDGRGRGLMLHTTLAVVPGVRRLLGLAQQQVFRRVPTPPGQTRRQRPKAERESRVWGQAVRAIGGPPAGVRWVVVADAATDDLDFLDTCRQMGLDFTIRLTYDHRLITEDEAPAYLFATAGAWPAVTYKMVAVSAKPGQPARQARVAVSYGAVALRRRPHSRERLPMWVVHAWEVDAPEGVEPLEWLLGTTVAVTTPNEALERLDWYSTRWLVEDYHQCLKTGCRIEQRDLEEAVRIERLLGFLAPTAVRLLQLRQEARQTPEQLATETIEPQLVRVLARHFDIAAESMTVYCFWRRVAQLGGFIGRRRDGEPGWKTIWRGWLELTTLAQGAALAALHPP